MKAEASLGCITIIMILLFNIIIGSMSINYITNYFGKDLPTIADVFLGLFLAEISVPIAFILWLFG